MPPPSAAAPRPPLGAHLRAHADLVLLVALAGAAGSLGRWAVDGLLPHASGQVPWSTVLVNVTGSAALGVLVVWLAACRPASRRTRPVVGTGLLGGWTTFSAAALDLQAHLVAGRWGVALLVVAVGLVLPVLAAGAAVAATRAVVGGPPPAGSDEVDAP